MKILDVRNSFEFHIRENNFATVGTYNVELSETINTIAQSISNSLWLYCFRSMCVYFKISSEDLFYSTYDSLENFPALFCEWTAALMRIRSDCWASLHICRLEWVWVDIKVYWELLCFLSSVMIWEVRMKLYLVRSQNSVYVWLRMKLELKCRCEQTFWKILETAIYSSFTKQIIQRQNIYRFTFCSKIGDVKSSVLRAMEYRWEYFHGKTMRILSRNLYLKYRLTFHFLA